MAWKRLKLSRIVTRKRLLRCCRRLSLVCRSQLKERLNVSRLVNVENVRGDHFTTRIGKLIDSRTSAASFIGKSAERAMSAGAAEVFCMLTYLLGVGRKYRCEETLPFLRAAITRTRGDLRADFVAEGDDVGIEAPIVCEYDGDHHHKPGKFGATEEERVYRNNCDRVKENQVRAAGFVFVRVPDLCVFSRKVGISVLWGNDRVPHGRRDGNQILRRARIAKVCELLEWEVPHLLSNRTYRSRKTRLQARPRLLDRRIHWFRVARDEQWYLQDADQKLRERGVTSIVLERYDLVGKKFTAWCSVPGCDTRWYPLRGNLLRKLGGRIPPSGCPGPACKGRKIGDRDRLKPAEIRQRGEALGFRLCDSPLRYKNNRSVLEWKCIRSNHLMRQSFEKLHRGCRECRGLSKFREPFERTKVELERRGYEVVSSLEEFANGKRHLRLRCPACRVVYHTDHDHAVRRRQDHICERSKKIWRTRKGG